MCTLRQLFILLNGLTWLFVNRNVHCLQLNEKLEFNAEGDAAILHGALSNLLIDGKTINELLSQRNCAQRVQIAQAFNSKYEKPLADFIKSRSILSYQTMLLSLFACNLSLFAFHLQLSFSLFGNNYASITEILVIVSQNPDMRDAMLKEYRNMFRTSLYADMQDWTSDDIQNIYLELLLRSRRKSEGFDEVLAVDLAGFLKEELPYWEDQRRVLNTILMEASFDQMKAIFDEFSKLAGTDIELAAANTLYYDKKDAYVQLIRFLKDYNEFVVDNLWNSLDGMGTNDLTLIRNILIEAEKKNLEEIKHRFKEKYSISLAEKISEDTSGDFLDILLRFVQDEEVDDTSESMPID